MRLPFGSNRLRNCVFCRIVEGREPNEIHFKDDKYTAFSDHRPASKNHLLIITNEHVDNITNLQGRTEVVDELVSVANQLLEERGADPDDVRLGFHVPPLISVSHIHLHVIWPFSEAKVYLRWKYKKKSTWFMTPEVAKQWLRDREEREAAARAPDDRDKRRRSQQTKFDPPAASAAAQAGDDGEDQDVADVTKKMAKMNK